MPLPTKKETHPYHFTDDIKFFQKAIVMHPRENKFLIIKRSDTDAVRPGTWDLPGGNVLYGEENETALRREIREETGLEVDGLKAVHFFTHYDPKTPMYYFVFGAIAKAKTDTITLSDEHTAYQWVTSETFLNMDPNYQYREGVTFIPYITDYLRDMVYLAFNT